MTVETFEIDKDLKPDVNVTSAAAAHLHRTLSPKGRRGVRIHLKKSGCTGYMYEIDEVDGPEDGDVTLDLDNGVKLYMPVQDLPRLRGMELDYVQEGVNRKLVFNNPNAQDACGCGESFSFKE